jgi:DNA-binding transcriptional regulator LsrR (DeoR family)
MNAELLKEIERLYYEEKLSARKVAATLHIATQTVKFCLTTYSAGIRNKSEACRLRTTAEYSEKIRATQLGELNTCAKLTEEKVKQIRIMYEELLWEGYNKTEAQYKLAKKYGVKRPTISDVVLRKTWKHI